ncbi:hypothetical protein PYCC9005_004636 [Savitreella phatthalungensis]
MHIQSFVIDAAHPRVRPRATRRLTDRLKLSGDCLSLAPLPSLSDTRPIPPDVSSAAAAAAVFNLVFLHGNGLPKELYYPTLSRILAAAGTSSTHPPSPTRCVRAIYAVDAATQGKSYALNRDKLGDEPDWGDLGLDLVCLVERFGLARVSRVVGIGHSMGGCGTLLGAITRPGLFAGVMAIDPVIYPFLPLDIHALTPEAARARKAQITAVSYIAERRRASWPTYDAAVEAVRKSAFFRDWNPDVVDRWIAHGIVEEDGGQGGWKLRTPPAAEVLGFLGVPMGLRPRVRRPVTYSDGDPADAPAEIDTVAERGETPGTPPTHVHFNMHDTATMVMDHLENIAHPVALLYGRESTPLPTEMQSVYTGRAIARGNPWVYTKVLDGGHLLPMENPADVANHCLTWLTTHVVPAYTALQRHAASDRPTLGDEGLGSHAKRMREEVENLWPLTYEVVKARL